MVERDRAGLLLTAGAGGFLPGVPLGCLGMASQRRLQLHLHRNGSGRPAKQAHHGSDDEWCQFQVRQQATLRSTSLTP
jgi:hypothetical protein